MKIEDHVLESVGKNLKEHVVTLLHDGGPNRKHYRCQKPGTWNMGFDLVTWPGHLCYTGDMGTYLFCRTDDMIAFMRGSCMSYSYAAEKCIAHDGRLKEWREELFLAALDERLADFSDDGGMHTVVRRGERVQESVADKIEEIKTAYRNYESKHDAFTAMHESGLWDELPSCEDWSFRFLWAMHAIKWAIAKIDANEVKPCATER